MQSAADIVEAPRRLYILTQEIKKLKRRLGQWDWQSEITKIAHWSMLEAEDCRLIVNFPHSKPCTFLVTLASGVQCHHLNRIVSKNGTGVGVALSHEDYGEQVSVCTESASAVARGRCGRGTGGEAPLLGGESGSGVLRSCDSFHAASNRMMTWSYKFNVKHAGSKVSTTL